MAPSPVLAYEPPVQKLARLRKSLGKLARRDPDHHVRSLARMLDLIRWSPRPDDRYIPMTTEVSADREWFNAEQMRSLIRRMSSDLLEPRRFRISRTSAQIREELLALEWRIRATVRTLTFAGGTRSGHLAANKRQMMEWIAERQRDPDSIYSCFR